MLIINIPMLFCFHDFFWKLKVREFRNISACLNHVNLYLKNLKKKNSVFCYYLLIFFLYLCVCIYLLIFILFNHHYFVYRWACLIYFEPLIVYNFVHNIIALYYRTWLLYCLWFLCLYVIIMLYVVCHAQ